MRARGVNAGRLLSAHLAIRLVTAGYLLGLFYLTFAPLPSTAHEPLPGSLPGLKLVPLESIIRALRVGPPSSAFWLLVGNIAAFVPLGFLLPLVRRGRTSWLMVLAAGAALSALIELGQLGISLLVGYPYRFAEVDDVILNTLGALLGYATLATSRRLTRRPAAGQHSRLRR